MVFKQKFQVGAGRKKSAIRLLSFLCEVILKLSAVKGFDSQLRIRNKRGEYIPHSNVKDLITHCATPGRSLVGEDEFIDLLAEIGVEPDTIQNEGVRAKLFARVGRHPRPALFRPHPSQIPRTNTSDNPDGEVTESAHHPYLPEPLPTIPKTPYYPEPRRVTDVNPGNDDVINIGPDIPDFESNDDELDWEPPLVVDENANDNSLTQPITPASALDEERTEISKNRIRPKALADRDRFERKQRSKRNRLSHLDLTNIDIDEPRQTRGSKRPRWDQPEDNE